METKIGVVIVLFHPKEFNFNELLYQSDIFVILVDNTPDSDLNLTSENVHYIPLKQNKGIASAQNVGICKAEELGCSHVMFYDQDSVIEKDFVSQMLGEYIRLKSIYSNIAILGPTIINKDNGKEYKSTNQKVVYDCKLVSALISSGTIVEMKLFNVIGILEDKLFIDYVDFEWCWRARSKGYVCTSTTRVYLWHKVGTEDRCFLGFPIIVSAPIRYYYQYRNYCWLIRRTYVPFKWKVVGLVRKLSEIILLPIMSKNGISILSNIIRGIKDGLFNLH